MPITGMSDYERKAYAALTASPGDSRSLAPQWAREKAAQVSASVRAGVSKIPGNEAIAEAYTKAATGLIDFTSGNGVKSVSLDVLCREVGDSWRGASADGWPGSE